MNKNCTAKPCPILLDSLCVYYSGGKLVHIGAETNDNLKVILNKIDDVIGELSAPLTSTEIINALGYEPLEDAPANGIIYGRKNNFWVPMIGVVAGTVTSVSVTPGTGISASVTNPSTTPNITITNTAPDQTVVLNSGNGISITGTYPNFTITATGNSAVWGAITGTLSSQTDLQNALNAKFNIPSGNISQYVRGDGSLAAFPSIPGTQVNSDWNATSGIAQILNKPTIPAAQIQSDWTQTNNTALDFIKNKPTIPAAQVNSDWNAISGITEILNKPVLATVATSGDYNDLLNLPTLPTGTVTSILAGTGMSFATITSSGTINIDTTKVPFFNTGFSPGFAKWNGSSWVFDNSVYLTSITSSDVTTALGYTPVTNARTITINGTTFDLTADRTWNVGTVTSVGLSMPAAFSVASSPVTGAGTLAVTAIGTPSQYIRGDGSLANLPTTPVSGGASVNYYLNGSVNQGTISGNTYYELGRTAILGPGTDFTINANGVIARFLTDVNEPGLLAIPAGNFIFLNYFSASSGGGSPQFYINLYKYDGTAFTLIASNSANPETITGGTSIDLYYSALAVPQTALAITDRLMVEVNVIHDSKIITLHTEDGHLSEMQTTLSTGLTALNGSVDTVQFLTTGVAGTNFGIITAGNTHTFNLPVASATNTGKLSNTDWTIFNNKVSSVGATPPLASSGGATPTISIADAVADGTTKGAATFDSNDFNSAAGVISIDYANGQAASSSTKGFLTAADWSTFNGKQNAISFSTTGTSGAATFIGNNLNIPVYTLAGLGGQPQLNGTGFVKASGTAISYDNTSYTPESRSITINGIVQDLSADRTWSVGDILSTGSYADPSWITSLDWSKITNVPALGGVSNLNTLTASTQTFAVGTSGTNFNISSAGSTHTFNLPNASAINRGALTSADWTTFNSKEPAITAGTVAQYFRGDKTFQTLDTSVVPENTNLYFTNARARNAISLTTNGSSGVASYSPSTGVLNVPQYGGTGGSGFGYTLVLGFNVTALAGNATYISGSFYGSQALNLATSNQRPSRWVIAPKVGTIVSASVIAQLNSPDALATPTSAVMTLRINNLTQLTSAIITSTFPIGSNLDGGWQGGPGSSTNPRARNDFFPLGVNSLAVNAGDRIQIQIVTPAWTTAPSDLSMNFVLFIE